MVDKLFIKFLKLFAKIVRWFIPKPDLGRVDTKKTDSLKEPR